MTVEYHRSFFPAMDKTLSLPMYEGINQYDTFVKLVSMYNEEFKIDPAHDPVQAFIDYAKWKSEQGETEIPVTVYEKGEEEFYIWFDLEGEAIQTVTDLEGLLEVFVAIVRKGLPLTALVDILKSLDVHALIEIKGEDGDVGHLIVATSRRKEAWLRLLIKQGLVTPEQIAKVFDERNEKDLPNNE